MIVQLGLCQTWSETLKTSFLALRLIYAGCKDKRLVFFFLGRGTIRIKLVYIIIFDRNTTDNRLFHNGNVDNGKVKPHYVIQLGLSKEPLPFKLSTLTSVVIRVCSLSFCMCVCVCEGYIT